MCKYFHHASLSMVKCITELPEHSEISLNLLLSCLGLLGCLCCFSNQLSETILEALKPPLSLSCKIVRFLSKNSNVFGLHFDKYCTITITALCGYVIQWTQSRLSQSNQSNMKINYIVEKSHARNMSMWYLLRKYHAI